MFKRIQKILNIGKFSDCRVPGCQLEKETIIFGLNTQGKSTLTAILRSLQTGNNNLLIGRKTFGATGSKDIEIDFEDAGTVEKYKFQNRVWDKINPNIQIFDSKFISENIFDGESITFDQQKSLNTVIIGKKGQELNIEIALLQKQSDELTAKKSEKTREFSRHFPGLDLDKFKSLIKDADIVEKIKSKEKEIKFEQDKEEIKKAIKSHIKNIGNINFSIKDILSKTLEAKQEEIENHIKFHFSKAEKAQNFLSEGLDFLKEKSLDGSPRICIFCGQELNKQAESLIQIYSAFFKGGYEELQKEIIDVSEYFTQINLEAILEKISTDLKSKELDIGLSSSKISEILNLKKDFEKELEKKRDLNYVVNFEAFEKLEEALKKIKIDLEDIETKKLNVPSVKTIAQLDIERKNLEVIKERHEPVWVNFCNDCDALEVEAEKIRTTRELKRKELDAYSALIFNTHKTTINHLCNEMGADFEIEDFKPLRRIVGRSERIFAIKFFGTHKVEIDNEEEKTPNFKNTLSESDKRLLAFAFFVSLLLHDKELDKKIVVFDDPMSSFDSERRRKTVHIITDIACKYNEPNGTLVNLLPKQKIILTHEDRFAKELKRRMPEACELKIEEYTDSNGQKRSRLSHADFSKDFPDDEISAKIEKIKNILDTQSFSTPFEEDCRIVLEHIFRRKYYLELKNDINLKKSVRTFTTTLNQNNVGGFGETEKFQKFLRLCEDLNIELHDNNNLNSQGDKESIIKDFFDCLKLI